MDKQEADSGSIMEFYADLIETANNYLKYYLSEDVVLDWFGRTIKGQKNVVAFIKTNVHPIKHFLREIKPVKKIGFRKSHQFKVSCTPRRILRSSLASPPRISLLSTPEKQQQPSPPLPPSAPSTSKSSTNCSLKKKPLFSPDDAEMSFQCQAKKLKLSPPEIATDITVINSNESNVNMLDNVKYLTADGAVEFHRPSTKKLQKETMWQRPCKVHLAYNCGQDVRDSLFYLIIYEGNLKCRRNLMADFVSVKEKEKQ